MKIDWKKVVLKRSGEPEKLPTGESLTVGYLCVNSLYLMTEQDRTLSGKDKYDLHKLAKKVDLEPDSDFTIEQLGKIKEHVGRKETVWGVGQVFECIENPLPKEAKDPEAKPA